MENLTPPQNYSTDWIEQLALEELNMEESGIVHMNEHLNPLHFLEESSIEFMNNLRERCEIYASKFNEYRGGIHNGTQIKIFKISNTINDFMLFRNSLRLVFARKANDLISIGFLNNGKDVFSARLNNKETPQQIPHEIKAYVGPFMDITWRFQGEPVKIDALVRHYLSEFVRQSAR